MNTKKELHLYFHNLAKKNDAWPPHSLHTSGGVCGYFEVIIPCHAVVIKTHRQHQLLELLRTGAMFGSEFFYSGLASIKVQSITIVLLSKENLRYWYERGGVEHGRVRSQPDSISAPAPAGLFSQSRARPGQIICTLIPSQSHSASLIYGLCSNGSWHQH